MPYLIETTGQKQKREKTIALCSSTASTRRMRKTFPSLPVSPLTPGRPCRQPTAKQSFPCIRQRSGYHEQTILES
jgi:hypothetical protein